MATCRVLNSTPLVFVVDDDPAVANVLACILKSNGCLTRVFTDPSQAARPELPAPDLLVTDYCMPAMNGVELMRRCRLLWPGLKTLMVSGGFPQWTHDQPERFLAKPFWPRELVQAVRELTTDGDYGPDRTCPTFKRFNNADRGPARHEGIQPERPRHTQ
ncbi:MAG: response regulator [Verrucomicrobiota bacterium]